jgi:hypothetical protein
VQHDSDWVNPNIFGMNYTSTRYLDRKSLSALDYWIKCLKDEGIYIWLDMHWRRPIKPADGVRGFNEIAAKKGIIWGYNYVNPDLMKLMKEFQHQYLNHVNYYTRLTYKNDPAVVGVLLTNENDLTVHFGVSFLPGQKNPVHKGLFDRELQAFAKATGLPGDRLSWEPGQAMYFERPEHRSIGMIDDQADGCAITSTSGHDFACSVLSEGDVIDVHSTVRASPQYQPAPAA